MIDPDRLDEIEARLADHEKALLYLGKWVGRLIGFVVALAGVVLLLGILK